MCVLWTHEESSLWVRQLQCSAACGMLRCRQFRGHCHRSQSRTLAPGLSKTLCRAFESNETENIRKRRKCEASVETVATWWDKKNHRWLWKLFLCHLIESKAGIMAGWVHSYHPLISQSHNSMWSGKTESVQYQCFGGHFWTQLRHVWTDLCSCRSSCGTLFTAL